MNENIQRAEIVYKALRDNKIPIGCAALGIIESALEYDRLQAAPRDPREKLAQEVTRIRAAVLAAMPTGVSFAAIVIALASLIETYQRRADDLD